MNVINKMPRQWMALLHVYNHPNSYKICPNLDDLISSLFITKTNDDMMI